MSQFIGFCVAVLMIFGMAWLVEAQHTSNMAPLRAYVKEVASSLAPQSR